VSVKEVKYRPKIGKGDFDTKTRNVIRFIEEGHKVKITLQFRGREMAHPELGSKILDGVLEAVGPAAKVDTQARLEGRSMSMTLSPDKQAQEAIKKAAVEAERQAKADAEAEVVAEAETEVEAAAAVEPVTEAETEAEVQETPAASEQLEGVSDAEDENVEDGS